MHKHFSHLETFLEALRKFDSHKGYEGGCSIYSEVICCRKLAIEKFVEKVQVLPTERVIRVSY